MGVYVGSVSVPGSTGNFSVSGLPFQPVALIVFNQFNHLGPWDLTIGCATGSSEQWCMYAGVATEISGYNSRKHEGRTDAVAIQRNSVTDAVQWQVAFVSFESDGFTLDLDVRNTVGSGEGGVIYYMALGGDHIPEAHAGTFTCGNSTGTTDVTAPGFQPTALIVGHCRSAAFDAGIASQAAWGVGIATATPLVQYSSFSRANVGVAIDGTHIDRTDAIACTYNGSDVYRAEVQSFDSTGFTINVADAHGAGDIEHGYLAINADGVVAGIEIQPDATGNQTYATPGLDTGGGGTATGGVFFCWGGSDAPSSSGSGTEPMRPGVAAATPTESRHSSAIYRSSASSGVYTSDAYQIDGSAVGFWGVGNGIGGSDNLAQADTHVDSMDPESFTLDWYTVLDTNNRQFGWLALPGELSFIPQIYRRPLG